MTRCPHRSLLSFENFAHGTPRGEIDELRATQRLVWEPDEHAAGGHWLVLQRADIDQVLGTPELFTNRFGPLLEDFPPEVLAAQQQTMTFMDPPGHTRYRRLVEPAFRPKATAAREPVMRSFAREILDGVIPQGRCEFVSEVALQMPMRVMYHVLGVRAEDFARVVDLTNTALLADDPDFAESRQAGFAASMQLMEFGAALAADHRRQPRDTLTMEVLDSGIDGHRITDAEFGMFFNNLIAGGLETTRNTLAWAMYELIAHPEQYRRLQADPALVPNAVEETLRHRNTVVFLRRTATRDLELAGEQIRRGDKLVCILGAPNRDSAFFERPDEFDITRPVEHTRRHYRTFGFGPHFCLGMAQARLNLTVMLEEIARRIHNPRLLAEPRFARSIFMDGFKELQIEFDTGG